MKGTLQHIILDSFTTANGALYKLPVSYQLFGKPLGTAPVVLVNHALTGNSDVGAWWRDVVGEQKVIDTRHFTVISFNIPGNGYDGFIIDNFEDFTLRDVAKVFLKALELLGVVNIHAVCGGSIGGALALEMAALRPDLSENVIAIACAAKTSDWLHAQCLVQKFLLESTSSPLEKARTHAMLCYRTPESLSQRFRNSFVEGTELRQSEDWLNFHGRTLESRFSLPAYKLMNHLLTTIDANPEALRKFQGTIHLVGIDSDLFFPAFEMKNLAKVLHCEESYSEIKSLHGHDAFLMEYGQLSEILKPIFR